MSETRTPDWIEEKLGQGREYRRMAQPMQAREASGEDDWDVEGYACTFGEFYTLFEMDGYRVEEQVDARAFNGCDMSDYIMQYDHHGRVFARSRNHTLTAEPDAHGLHTLARLGGTELGRQVREEIRGGYSDRMSFAFTVKRDKREIIEDHDTGLVTVRRTILEISKLYDVSVVSMPANDATEIFARSLEAGESNWAAQELRAYEARRKARARLRLRLKLAEVKA